MDLEKSLFMKVVIINAFDTLNERMEIVHRYFDMRKEEVKIFISNFSHRHKSYVKSSPYTLIEVPPYQKNLSRQRIQSHLHFSKKVIQQLEQQEEPDCIYAIIPPNSLVKQLTQYKKKHPQVKIIVDIQDLWPESMPFPKASKPFLSPWRNLRDHALSNMDYVILECNLYHRFLNLNNHPWKTIYLAKKQELLPLSEFPKTDSTIKLAYLGSLNHIVDIPRIKDIVQQLSLHKSVEIHVIASGEKKDFFMQEMKEAHATVIDHGLIFDTKQKQAIFDSCHLGINILKETVCVGLTMKSLDYFYHGLPLLNSIPDDTKQLVDQYQAGVNVSQDVQKTCQSILEYCEQVPYEAQKKRAQLCFQEQFSTAIFNLKMDEVLHQLFQ